MCWKELVSSMIWGCALFKDLSRARLAVDVMLNSSQCIARRNKTALQWVWWLCAKPLSGHQAQGPILHCMSMPRSYPSQCEQCAYIARQSIWQRNKDIFLQRNLSHVLYEYCWGGGGLFVFVCFFWGGREGLVDFFLISLQSCRILRKEVLDEIPVPLKSLGKFLLTSPGSASIYSMVPCVFFLGDTQIICALLTNQTFLFLF